MVQLFTHTETTLEWTPVFKSANQAQIYWFAIVSDCDVCVVFFFGGGG